MIKVQPAVPPAKTKAAGRLEEAPGKLQKTEHNEEAGLASQRGGIKPRLADSDACDTNSTCKNSDIISNSETDVEASEELPESRPGFG